MGGKSRATNEAWMRTLAVSCGSLKINRGAKVGGLRGRLEVEVWRPWELGKGSAAEHVQSLS